MERWLLGQVTIRSQSGQEMDEEVERAAVARVLNLTDILELIVDRLDQCPLTEQELVGKGEQPVLHVRAQLRDQA
jgi:hypothetical protein